MAQGKDRRKHKNSNTAKREEAPVKKVNQSALGSNGLDIKTLTEEADFIRYVELLKPFAENYTILICVEDTPCGGPDFTPQVGAKINDLGTKINLSGMYRCPYAAIIHKGELLFEKVGIPQAEIIEYETFIEKIRVKIKSAPFPISKQVPDLDYGITVNNMRYGAGRGFSFVVFDIQNDKLLDSAFFDVFPKLSQQGLHLDYPLAEVRYRIVDYKNSHPEVSVVTYGDIRFPCSNMSENEKFIDEFNDVVGAMLLKLGTVPALERYFDNIDDIKEVLTPPKSYNDIYGVRRFEDVEGKLVNTRGGIRVTAGQPQSYKRTLFVAGLCSVFGYGCADKDTVASYLQGLLNRFAPDEEIIVQNYGFYCSRAYFELPKIVNSLPVKAGDIVVIHYLIKQQPEIGAIDMADISTRPHNYGELFFDAGHYTQEAYSVFAEKIYEHLKENNFYSDRYNEQICVLKDEDMNALKVTGGGCEFRII